MDSRQAQKSPPSVRPRRARWNAWQWAFTNPGRRRVSTTAVSCQHMAVRAVPAPLAQLPNALTIARLALIPVFVVLRASTSEGGHSWPAAILFGAAGVTDQVDGYLARRWHVESRFGKIADPLADRLMIDAAVILLWHDGPAAVARARVIPAATCCSSRAAKLRRGPRATSSQVNIGRQGRHLAASTRSLAFVLVTHDGHRLAALALLGRPRAAAVALAGYAASTRRREVKPA